MWPWKRKQQADTEADLPSNEEAVVPELPMVSISEIGDAIITLRGDGFHFAMSYAQMGGYDAALLIPDRFSEIIQIIEEEPNFSDEGIKFAAAHQISELSSIAKTDNAYLFVAKDSFATREEKEKAREVIGLVSEIGKGNLKKGFEEVGFDFEQFLVSTATKRRRADIDQILNLAVEKKTVLRPLFVRALSAGRDRYGDVQYDKLSKEVEDFIENFFPEGSFKFFHMYRPFRAMFRLACAWAEESLEEHEFPTTGLDFEHWCAAQIESQGWNVTVSKASGDQGVDLIAMRESLIVAVQCKLYSTPIGNKAVQEAYAGTKHYCADMAVVIGTGGFTRSAIELAQTTDVVLVDAEAIRDFTQFVMDRI